ncbi:MAG: hypothetical protein ABEI86_05120, partial [Halobacteriaceae archaeon]
TISFAHDESAVERDESALRVFRFNETLGTYVPLNTSVDAANNTLSVETTHFSVYTVMEPAVWFEQFDTRVPSKWSVDQRFNVSRSSQL